LRKKHSEIQKRIQGTPEARKNNSERSKKRFKNEDDRKAYFINLSNLANSPEARLSNSIAKKKYFLNKDNLLKHDKMMKEVHGRLENVKKNRDAQIKLWKGKRELPTGVYKHGDGYRAKISKNNKLVHILYSKSIDECHQAYLKYISN
jgi:hypothetical protein